MRYHAKSKETAARCQFLGGVVSFGTNSATPSAAISWTVSDLSSTWWITEGDLVMHATPFTVWHTLRIVSPEHSNRLSTGVVGRYRREQNRSHGLADTLY